MVESPIKNSNLIIFWTHMIVFLVCLCMPLWWTGHMSRDYPTLSSDVNWYSSACTGWSVIENGWRLVHRKKWETEKHYYADGNGLTLKLSGEKKGQATMQLSEACIMWCWKASWFMQFARWTKCILLQYLLDMHTITRASECSSGGRKDLCA